MRILSQISKPLPSQNHFEFEIIHYFANETLSVLLYCFETSKKLDAESVKVLDNLPADPFLLHSDV